MAVHPDLSFNYFINIDIQHDTICNIKIHSKKNSIPADARPRFCFREDTLFPRCRVLMRRTKAERMCPLVISVFSVSLPRSLVTLKIEVNTKEKREILWNRAPIFFFGWEMRTQVIFTKDRHLPTFFFSHDFLIIPRSVISFQGLLKWCQAPSHSRASCVFVGERKCYHSAFW